MSLHAVIVYARSSTLPAAYRWCAARGFEVESVVPRDRYADVVQLLAAGRAQIIVAASPDALDPDRVPRVEIVPDDGDADRPNPCKPVGR